jgi:hypothetical protein
MAAFIIEENIILSFISNKKFNLASHIIIIRITDTSGGYKCSYFITI